MGDNWKIEINECKDRLAEEGKRVNIKWWELILSDEKIKLIE